MTGPLPTPDSLDDATLQRAAMQAASLVAECERVYHGDPTAIRLLLTALFARGHVLIEGVPGVAKTTLAKAFAQTLGSTFRRIQFTSDLLPSDVTGTYVFDQQRSSFVLREGPIFANVVLGDEINRAPGRTQSALLEAMGEQQVTIEGETRALPFPFFVVATQNPIEYEGTYPLPEAQIDRFLLRVRLGYPKAQAERRMLEHYASAERHLQVQPVLSPIGVAELQKLVDRVHTSEEIYDYVIALAQFTREHRHVALPVSPRASLQLLSASKARALSEGRGFVLPDDIRALLPHVLGHRLVLHPEAADEGVTVERVLADAETRVGFRGRPHSAHQGG